MDHKVTWLPDEVDLMARHEELSRRQFARDREDLSFELLRLPDGEFCPWGGLNPHLPSGQEAPVCRACRRNEGACTDKPPLDGEAANGAA